ncbi:G protein-activated inward rectifier potassium channel 2-like [Corticium candelabrum]|uniref:G protein-activated inward rectifier potassium channel 2-like n=1 Tax=Corticium candelabrum TaxID=121492 RepID=UPI002E265E85|nr:G protein-activated inward rectifier potassium channel 2-like [Corticium candelabrum]
METTSGKSATNIQSSDENSPLVQVSDPSGSTLSYATRKPFRLISKDGDSLVTNVRVENKFILYLKDLFTTLLHLPWHWLILAFGAVYMLSWIGFALIWWALSAAKGSDERPCTTNVHNFSTAFLLSVETQTTIGFGDVIISSSCSVGLIVLSLQCLFGILLDAIMMGVIFTKVARPRERGQTVVFSDKAVIVLNHEDDYFYLMCRVGDIRKSHILEAHIRASLYHKEEHWESTSEQSRISIRCEDLDVGYDTGRDRIFLLLPVIVRHKIDSNSPFYKMSPEDLQSAHIEVVINLEGTMEATGMITQKLVSYIPDEIFWGFRFKPVVCVKDGMAHADFSLLNDILPDPGTPQCSAEIYFERQIERST